MHTQQPYTIPQAFKITLLSILLFFASAPTVEAAFFNKAGQDGAPLDKQNKTYFQHSFHNGFADQYPQSNTLQPTGTDEQTLPTFDDIMKQTEISVPQANFDIQVNLDNMMSVSHDTNMLSGANFLEELQKFMANGGDQDDQEEQSANNSTSSSLSDDAAMSTLVVNNDNDADSLPLQQAIPVPSVQDEKSVQREHSNVANLAQEKLQEEAVSAPVKEEVVNAEQEHLPSNHNINDSEIPVEADTDQHKNPAKGVNDSADGNHKKPSTQEEATEDSNVASTVVSEVEVADIGQNEADEAVTTNEEVSVEQPMTEATQVNKPVVQDKPALRQCTPATAPYAGEDNLQESIQQFTQLFTSSTLAALFSAIIVGILGYIVKQIQQV